MRRLCSLLALTVALAVVGAGPAAAHDRSEDASNWWSTVVTAPDVPGADWTVYSGGVDIEIVNRSASEITILGYENEPYLRVGPSGVYLNRNSPAAYLNADRYADVAIPRRADADAEPDWHHVSGAVRYVWHDHRTHWMAPDPPRGVQQARGSTHLVQTWEIPVLVDGAAQTVTGELWWIPPPPASRWLLVVAALTVAGIVVTARRDPDRALLTGAIALGAVAAANSVHIVDEIVARPLPTIDVVAGALHTGMFVVIGVGTALWVWRARWGRRLILAFGSATVLLQEGLLQITVLRSSQITTVWPHDLVRGLAVASIAQAGIAVGALIASRRAEGPEPDRPIGMVDESRLPAGVR